MKKILHTALSKYNIFCFVVVMQIMTVCAQNSRFSQFYFAPTLVNPGNTGLIDGQYRISGITRNQWSTVTVPYNTANISFDGNLYLKKLSMDQFGYGLFMIYDESGNGSLTVLQCMPSLAFHKAIDESGKYNLSLGAQAGFIQKSINVSALTFPDQYNGSYFDHEITTQQTFADNNIFNFDAGVGVMWYYIEKGKVPYKIQFEPPVGKLLEAQLGASLSQVNRARESFLGNRDSRLYYKYAVHGKMVYSVLGRLSVHGSFMYLRQRTVSDLVWGGDAEYIFESMEGDVSVSLGARYRWKDALIIVVGHRKNEWKTGLSFDVNVSSLKRASLGYGSIEIATSYIFKYSKKIPCPKWKDY